MTKIASTVTRRPVLSALCITIALCFIGTGCGGDNDDDDDSGGSSRRRRGGGGFGYSADVRPQTLDELARAVVDTLRNKDEEGYLALCPTQDDLLAVFDKNMASVDLSKMPERNREMIRRRQDMMRQQMKDKWQDLINRQRRSFQDALRAADWSDAEIDRIKEGTVRKRNGVESASYVSVYFKNGEVNGYLNIDDPVRVDAGWVVGDALRFYTSSHRTKTRGFNERKIPSF